MPRSVRVAIVSWKKATVRLRVASLIVFLAATARADQCEWMEKGQAMKAASVLKEGSQVLTYCEPCGDKPRQVPNLEIVRSVSVQQAEGNFWEVLVNGTVRDVAYLFIKTGTTRAENVAALAGCPAVDVSREIEVPARTEAASSRRPRGRIVRCTIRQNEAVAFDGPCEFLPVKGSGSFSLSAREETRELLPGILIVSVNVTSPGIAEVRGLTSAGINSLWGGAKRSREDGACWEGSDFEICAR